MPTCSEAYGEGWVGTYPNCTYNPQGQTIRNMRINPDQYSKSVKDPFTGTEVLMKMIGRNFLIRMILKKQRCLKVLGI